MRVSRAISVSVVGDAKIDNQIATAGRVRQVVDDLDISALLARARGNPLCLQPCVRWSQREDRALAWSRKRGSSSTLLLTPERLQLGARGVFFSAV